MAGDALFRWVLLVGIVLTMAIALPFRIGSATREKLDRRKEGAFILATLRPAGAALWFGIFAYVIRPAWMTWSQVTLPDSWRWAGIIPWAGGVALLTWTLPTLGKNLTDTVVTREKHTLVTRGPYRWIRHPFYGSMALVSIGAAVIAANWFILLSAAAVFTLLAVRVRVEEEQLALRFGDAYRAYQRRTGRFLPKLGRSVHLALIGATVAGAAVLAAQQQPVFRSTTHYVRVDVVVTDRDDRPISDLTKDDFEISEAGRPQKLSDFTFVSIPLANRTVNVDAPPGPPSDVGSNSPALRSSRAIVIFVDDSSLSTVLNCPDCPEVIVATKNVLTRFLQSLSSDDQVALIWQSRSDASQDFTNDIPRLVAAVNSRKAVIGLTPIGPPWRPRVNSLKFAVAALAGSQYARRAIVFVGVHACNPVPMAPNSAPGAGFDTEPEECRDLYKKAREANVPIYAIDPRVLPMNGDDTLAELAINTGGRHFMQQSNPQWAVDQIVSENGSFYTLGFYPDPIVNDGKYHEFKVTVKRPGLRVRARDRYLADSAAPAKSTPQRDMTKSLATGLDDPSIPIRAFVAPLAQGIRGYTKTLVTLEVGYQRPDAGDMTLKDELRLGILALSPDAKIKSSFQRPIKFTGKWKPTARGTLVLNEVVDLPSEELTLRVGVTSQALGKTGTTHVRLDVPNYRKTELQLSPIVIGSSAQVIDAAIGLDILRTVVPFQPTTVRSFVRGDKLRVLAFAYWGSNETRLTSDVQVDGESIRWDTPAVRTPVLGRREATIDTSLALDRLSPGPHALSVVVELSNGKRAVRAVPFSIQQR